jgi:hypothetical protein
MRLHASPLLLLLAPASWAQSVTPRVLAGQNYCHEVQLTSTWTVDAKGDEDVRNSFREGQGKLTYRAAGPDSVLVSFFVEKYDSGLASSRVYSSRKILLPLKNMQTAQAATEQQWNSAAALHSYTAPAFLPTGVSSDAGVRYHGFEFVKSGKIAGEHPFLVSPGGDWIALLSWSGVVPSGAAFISFVRAKGSMYVEVDRVASGDRAIRVQLDFNGTEPSQILPHAIWVSDRHLVFPVNRLQTRLMVCDLSPFYSGSPSVFYAPAKSAEILGFSEETTIFDVAGTLGGFVLHVGVRVPEDGKYRMGGTIANEKGQASSGTREYDLTAGVNRIDFGLEPPRQVDGKLKVSNLRLEKMSGKNVTLLDHLDSVGTFGPFVLTSKQWEPRRKAWDDLKHPRGATPIKGETSVIKPSPLKSRTLTGKIENITGAPNAAGKFETLRLKLQVPVVVGDCIWNANVEAGGKVLASTNTKTNSAKPADTIVFEFPGGLIAAGKPDDDLRLSGVVVMCREAKMTGWVHSFDQFPKYLIPGIHPSMFRPDRANAVRFTHKNRVELIDSNHDGKYEVLKVTLGFKADRPCRISATLKDSEGSQEQIYAPEYDPRTAEVIFLIGFDNQYSAGEHFLDGFNVSCDAKNGIFRPVTYDKSYRLSLGSFSSEQFQPAIELSFANLQPILDNGSFLYKVNCTPHWTLDLPVDFSLGDVPATDISFDPPHGACKPNATTLRFKPLPDAPPLRYDVTVNGQVGNSHIFAMATTYWVKPSVPEVLGLRPNAGSGKRVVIQLAADDLSTGVPKIELLINDKEDIRRACHITSMGLVTTLSDDGGGSARETRNPNWLSVENSQCVIEKGYIGGLTVPLRFKAGFDGLKNIYVRAWNGAGATSGWTKQGTWTVSQNEVPVPISVSPYLGAANRQTFTFTFADANGAADLIKLDALIAYASADDHTCHLAVDRATGRATLLDGAASHGSIPLGGSGRVSGAQCAVENVHVIEESGRMLRLSADFHFTSAFRGRRNVFLKSGDKGKLESVWVWAGSWNVP